jgi:hypothetical protein
MLMRYVAVTLLLAALAASAARAQSPQRESQPPSSQPQGQGPELYKVKPQPDSPLRFTVQTYWLDLKMGTKGVFPNGYEFFHSVENVSDRAVSAYAIRPILGIEIPGFCVRNLPPDKVLQPGQSEGRSSWDTYSPLTPVHTFEVDFVEFTDGTTWGADVCRSAESLAGQRAGAAAAAGRLLELSAASGPDSVMKAVREELAGWDLDAVYKEAIKLGLLRRGPDGVLKAVKQESSDGAPLTGHSPIWELGYFIGTKMIAYRVREAFKKSGPGEIEPTLRGSYDAAGAN